MVETPLPISGIIKDDNISRVSINGQSVPLSPGTSAGEYRFSAMLQLSTSTTNTLLIEARDRAGNSSTKQFDIAADLTVTAQIINPAAGATVAHSDDAINLDVIAQIGGLAPAHEVILMINDSDAQAMSVSGDTARLSPSVQLNEGQNTLVVEVRDETGRTVAKARRTLSSETTTLVPLALASSEPAANSQHLPPNTPITLSFNRTDVDLNAVTVNVSQSVHGKAYDLAGQQGAEFTAIPAPVRINVNLDRARVPGSTVVFADSASIQFYPDQSLYYGATVFVDVDYNEESLSRFSFSVQALPTRIVGILTDPLGEPLGDTQVHLPELQLSTLTAANGSFDFGAGETQRVPIASGRYRLLVNAQQSNPALGTVEQWASVQQGTLNKVGRVTLPRMLVNEPFVPLAGGAQVSLYRGAVQLDLSQATLRFANGDDSGSAQAQMLLIQQLPHSVSPAAIPMFAWHLQPSGIEVNGTVSLSINIPPFQGGYSHVPPSGVRVALIGFDAQSRQLMPVGVGRVDGRQIHSTGALELESLDYLAYALVPAQGYQALLDWEAGKITHLEQLQGRLLEAAQ